MREKTDCTGGMAISVHFVGKNALPAAASGRPRGRSIARAQQLRIFAPLSRCTKNRKCRKWRWFTALKSYTGASSMYLNLIPRSCVGHVGQ
jgi:hypothetical protein